MEYPITILTEQDKAILHSYLPIAESAAELWGEGCEVVIHDLSRLDSSVIKICNGSLSGRQEGSPISDVALSVLNKMMANPDLRHIIYFAKNNRGEAFKASIAAIEGTDGHIIGLFCMNFYLSSSIATLLETFMPTKKAACENISENFVENTQELMLNALDAAKKTVYNDLSISSSNKNKEIISILYQKGIFNLKDSVVSIANQLGISKNTVYMHIRNRNK